MGASFVCVTRVYPSAELSKTSSHPSASHLVSAIFVSTMIESGSVVYSLNFLFNHRTKFVPSQALSIYNFVPDTCCKWIVQYYSSFASADNVNRIQKTLVRAKMTKALFVIWILDNCLNLRQFAIAKITNGKASSTIGTFCAQKSKTSVIKKSGL